MKEQIRQFIDDGLLSEKFLEKIEKSLMVFDGLDPKGKYILAFSGGKDSHSLLALYILFMKLTEKSLDIVVKFSDTLLEEKDLIDQVDKVGNFCDSLGLKFVKTIPPKTYWHYQFGIGYPVPFARGARWCTTYLKVRPLQEKDRRNIVGVHYGESSNRDSKLKKSGCGSSNCGEDKIKEAIKPILNWDNDDVWVFCLLSDGLIFPDGFFSSLSDMYEKNVVTSKGSLRMGCIMCPVVKPKTILGNKTEFKAYQIRLLLEELRKARRLKSPKHGSKGAIYIKDRLFIWNYMEKRGLLDYLQENNWITSTERFKVKRMLLEGGYPQTYKRSWIESEHSLLADSRNPYDESELDEIIRLLS